VTFGFHRLAALIAGWPAALGDFLSPAGQGAGLAAGTPKADNGGFFGVVLDRPEFL
jgi:hypothetical protein